MPRIRRSHLPGAVFHLTARTQGREPWFTEVLRSRITQYLAAAIRVSDTQLLAFAIMPNHLHLVVLQGARPLTYLMQPFLLRTALLVQRSHGINGHVFERRFRDRACFEPDHVRNAVVYTHLNPVRAGLASEPGSYRWTSHALYVDHTAAPRCIAGVLAARSTLSLFCANHDAELAERRRAYSRYVAWRMQCDRDAAARASGEATAGRSPPPVPVDLMRLPAEWHPMVNGHARRGKSGLVGPSPSSLEPEHIVKEVLAERAPHLQLERLRSNSKTRTIVQVRRTAIVRLHAAGFRTGAIARYLRVSDQCVSNVLSADRERRARVTGPGPGTHG